MRYDWKKLNNQQIGAFGEYYVKMELTMYGFQIYSTEIDDRGIDFVAKYESGPFLSFQVKSIRSATYVFVHKDKFELSPNWFLALTLLHQGREPEIFLIPSKRWMSPNSLFVDRDYEGKKSKPEWGLNLSKKNRALLEEYSFPIMLHEIIAAQA